MSRGERSTLPEAACYRSRPAIAHRDPSANMLQGWFPGFGVGRSQASGRLGAFPSLYAGSVAIAEFNTPLPLRGQRRNLPASQFPARE
jgi:hypothetical protein